MSPEAFCYWLQGYVEIADETPEHDQWELIVQHLQMVFQKQVEEGKLDFHPMSKEDLNMLVC